MEDVGESSAEALVTAQVSETEDAVDQRELQVAGRDRRTAAVAAITFAAASAVLAVLFLTSQGDVSRHSDLHRPSTWKSLFRDDRLGFADEGGWSESLQRLLPWRAQERGLDDVKPAKGLAPIWRGGQSLNPYAKQDKAICTGHVMAASAWLAAASLKVKAAVQECDPRNYGPDPQNSVVSPGPALPGQQAFVHVNNTLLPAFCSRSVLGIIRDFTRVGVLLEGCAATCQNEDLVGIGCATAVTNLVSVTANIGRFGSELDIFCPNGLASFQNYFNCADRLEGIAWSIDIWSTSMGASVEECANVTDGNSKVDYAACVGELLSAAAYVGSSGLSITSAADFDCPSSYDPKEYAAMSDDQKERARYRCARDATSFARTIGLSSSKAIRAGGHCGGSSTLCGRTIGRAAAALAGVAEDGTFLYQFCHPPTKCCKRDSKTFKVECNCTPEDIKENKEADEQDRELCSRFSASTVKMLSAAVTLIFEARAECDVHEDFASNACASFVSAAVASLGYLAESISRQVRRCAATNNPRTWFACSQDTGFVGDALDTLSRGIGAATVNCGLGDVKRQTNFINFGRRFFVP